MCPNFVFPDLKEQWDSGNYPPKKCTNGLKPRVISTILQTFIKNKVFLILKYTIYDYSYIKNVC